MATQAISFLAAQLPSDVAQQSAKDSLPDKTKQKELNFGKFRADLAALYLLPAEELERKWLEVERKNKDKQAQGLQINPYTL